MRHIYNNYLVPPYYDSLIAKLVAYGPSREEAIARMRSALSEMVVDGIKTNLSLHRRIMSDKGFNDADFTIHYLEQSFAK